MAVLTLEVDEQGMEGIVCGIANINFRQNAIELFPDENRYVYRS